MKTQAKDNKSYWSKNIFVYIVAIGISFLGAKVEARQKIYFPCSKNKGDDRVLVDGLDYDRKLASLGYKRKMDKWGYIGYHVGYKVLKFEKSRDADNIWSQGFCYLELLPGPN